MCNWASCNIIRIKHVTLHVLLIMWFICSKPTCQWEVEISHTAIISHVHMNMCIHMPHFFKNQSIYKSTNFLHIVPLRLTAVSLWPSLSVVLKSQTGHSLEGPTIKHIGFLNIYTCDHNSHIDHNCNIKYYKLHFVKTN